MQIENFKKTNIPDRPGVYFFTKGKEILYIGKATSLKERVRSYFGKDLIETRGPLLVDLVFKADNIKWEITESVLEALVLEAALIKKYKPKYNTKEKSDKSFNYVCILKNELPRVQIIRGKTLNEEKNKKSFSNIFGPFTNSSQLKEALKIIRPIFPYLDDKSDNNYEFYRQVSLVPDITKDSGIEKYKKDIKNLQLFFEGKKKDVMRNLKKEMMSLAKEMNFEEAGVIKKQIFALKHINDVALLKDETSKDFRGMIFKIEAYDVAHMSGKNIVGVMTVVENGEIAKNQYKKFKIKTQTGSNDTGALKEILERRFAHKEWSYPDLLVVDGGIAQINTAKKVFKKLNLDISIVSVLKDDKHKPKDILGDKENFLKYKKDIILANSEAHRFAISYHKNMRNKNFLK